MSYTLTANTPPPVVIHLDSRKGNQIESGLTTNFTYTLKEPLLVPDHMNLLLSLHTATIPYSFYNVGSHNNRFNFRIFGFEGVGTSEDAPFDLPAGNYSATGLGNAIKSFLEGFLISGSSGAITSFHFSYSRETLKYSMSFEGGATALSILESSTALDLLGIVGLKVIPLSATPSLISDNAIDLNDSIHGLYVRQNIATKGTLDTEEGTFSNILARIPITTNAGGIIFYWQEPHDTMISIPMIQTIGIRLTDDKHRSINLNGLHFQLSLKISYIHKETLRDLQPRRYEPTPLKPTPLKIDEKKKKKKK